MQLTEEQLAALYIILPKEVLDLETSIEDVKAKGIHLTTIYPNTNPEMGSIEELKAELEDLQNLLKVLRPLLEQITEELQ